MKNQSIIKSVLFAAAFSTVALIGSAQAQVLNTNSVINVQMGYDGTDGVNLNGTGYSSTVSPLAYTGSVWNEQSATSANASANSNLLYANGSGSSGISYSTVGLFAADQFQGSNVLPLLENTTYNAIGAATNRTLEFSGLNNALTYDIAIAAQAPGIGYTVNFILGGSTQSTTLNSESTWVDGQNFVEFDNIAPTSGNITITVESGGIPGASPSVPQYEYINGFQIGAVTPPVEAPEPSTYALMGLGALALVVISRRRRRTI